VRGFADVTSALQFLEKMNRPEVGSSPLAG
jgi:hypothetical protein